MAGPLLTGHAVARRELINRAKEIEVGVNLRAGIPTHDQQAHSNGRALASEPGVFRPPVWNYTLSPLTPVMTSPSNTWPVSLRELPSSPDLLA